MVNKENTLNLISLAQIQSQQVDWLWYPYIPRGKITLLVGDPGSGKTMLSLLLASKVSLGEAIYEAWGDAPAPANVIYQTAEDGIADTIKPRLEGMMPDFSRIFIIDESEQGLTLSDSRIEEALLNKKPSLMIIDPVQAYLGATVDMHRANQVRPVIHRLGILAERHNCAVIMIMHMSKMSQTKALHRALGSVDFVAAARSMLVVGCNPEDSGQRIIAHEKSSLSPAGKSIAFRMVDGKIVFEGYSELTADQIIGSPKVKPQKGRAFESCTELLKDFLSENGYARLSDIKAQVREMGLSERTLNRAKQALGLKSLTIGFSEKVTWWMYPQVDKKSLRDSHSGD